MGTARAEVLDGLRVRLLIAALPRVAADLGTDPDVVNRLGREYETHLRVLRINRDRRR